jgi:hypothetical protein
VNSFASVHAQGLLSQGLLFTAVAAVAAANVRRNQPEVAARRIDCCTVLEKPHDAHSFKTQESSGLDRYVVERLTESVDEHFC